MEELCDYERGGHHPVHLNDLLGPEKQYRVIHKLGDGSFSKVWLCQDTTATETKYIALKILMADASISDCGDMQIKKLQDVHEHDDEGRDHICFPRKHFEMKGPNGHHHCFIYPILGPPVSHLLRELDDPEKALRNIAYQVVQGLVYLHNNGICHGDLTPSNVLLELSGLDGLPESKVLSEIGAPKLRAGRRASLEDATRPEYLVRPVNFRRIDCRYLRSHARIIDFGESFPVDRPPRDLGTTAAFSSPELVIKNEAGFASDLWALACTLFEIRTGRWLFDVEDDDLDHYLDQLEWTIGRLPRCWSCKRSTQTPQTEFTNYFGDFGNVKAWAGAGQKGGSDDGSEEGDVTISLDDLDDGEETPRHPFFSGFPTEVASHISSTPSSTTDGGDTTISEEFKSYSIEDKLRCGLSYSDPKSGIDVYRPIEEEEVSLLSDLLRSLLRYRKEKRMPAQAVLDHPWFRM